MAEMTRVNIGMTIDMKEALQKEASDKGLSMSALIVVMLNQVIETKRAVDSMIDIHNVLDRLEQMAAKVDK